MKTWADKYVGKEVTLDLGQIGPSTLKVLSYDIKKDSLIMKHKSTGKVISLDHESFYHCGGELK